MSSETICDKGPAHPAWCDLAECTVDDRGLGVHRSLVVAIGTPGLTDHTEVCLELPVGGGGGAVQLVIERFEDDESAALIAFAPEQAFQTGSAIARLLGMLTPE